MSSLRREVLIIQALKADQALKANQALKAASRTTAPTPAPLPVTEAKTAISPASETNDDHLKTYFKRSNVCVNDYPADAKVLIGKQKTPEIYLHQKVTPGGGAYEPTAKDSLDGSLVEFTYKNKVHLMLPKESAPKTAKEFMQLAYAINMNGCGRFITEEKLPPVSLPLIDKLYTEEDIHNNGYIISALIIDSSRKIPLILNLLNDAASAGDKRAQLWLHGLKVSTPVSEGHLKAQQWLSAFEKAKAQALARGLTALTDPNLFRREKPKNDNKPASIIAAHKKLPI